MTNYSAELQLMALYGDTTKELTNLVMAAEKAFDDYGKKSILEKTRGKRQSRNLLMRSFEPFSP